MNQYRQGDLLFHRDPGNPGRSKRLDHTIIAEGRGIRAHARADEGPRRPSTRTERSHFSPGDIRTSDRARTSIIRFCFQKDTTVSSVSCEYVPGPEHFLRLPLPRGMAGGVQTRAMPR